MHLYAFPSVVFFCCRRHVYASKKRLCWHRHKKAFFGLKTDFNKKKKRKSRNDQCQAHYQQTKFKKVTCPFNIINIKPKLSDGVPTLAFGWWWFSLSPYLTDYWECAFKLYLGINKIYTQICIYIYVFTYFCKCKLHTELV